MALVADHKVDVNICSETSAQPVTPVLIPQAGLASSPSVSCILHFIGDTW